MKFYRLIALGLACTVPTLVLAQWQWIDKNGRKVFSDQSPPPEIPAKNILKQPANKDQPASVAVQPATAAVATAVPASGSVAAIKPTASAPRISGKDKELEERKKQAETAEAEKTKAEQEKVAKIKADNCARAKQGKANFDSGTRIAVTNAKGEREIMDDATRAAELKRLVGILEGECKT